MSERKSIEKARMEFAFENSKNPKDPKKYESYVLKVPAFLHTNGLGNTIAFIAAQSNDNWIKVGENIFDWLNSANSPIAEQLNNEFDSLVNSDNELSKLIRANKTENAEKRKKQLKTIALVTVLKSDFTNETIYKACTVEIFALFNWLRRFAKINKN